MVQYLQFRVLKFPPTKGSFERNSELRVSAIGLAQKW